MRLGPTGHRYSAVEGDDYSVAAKVLFRFADKKSHRFCRGSRVKLERGETTGTFAKSRFKSVFPCANSQASSFLRAATSGRASKNQPPKSLRASENSPEDLVLVVCLFLKKKRSPGDLVHSCWKVVDTHWWWHVVNKTFGAKP